MPHLSDFPPIFPSPRSHPPRTIYMEARKSNRSLDAVKPEKKPFVIDSVSVSSKMPEYNGLKDANLRAYFSSKRKRKLLQKVGLVGPTQVSTKGEILSHVGDTSRRGREDMRKTESGVFHSPEPNRSVYVTKARSQSVKTSSGSKKLALKPVTHTELQDLFAKYRPAAVVQEVLSQSKLLSEGPAQ